jgi:hypothetical protein
MRGRLPIATFAFAAGVTLACAASSPRVAPSHAVAASSGSVEPPVADGLASVGTGLHAPRVVPIGTVQLEDVTVVGALAREGVVAVLDGLLPSIQECHRAVLERSDTADGKLVVRVLLGAPQRVVNAGGGSVEPSLQSCVQERLKTAAFPSPSTGVAIVTVTYAFESRAP